MCQGDVGEKVAILYSANIFARHGESASVISEQLRRQRLGKQIIRKFIHVKPSQPFLALKFATLFAFQLFKSVNISQNEQFQTMLVLFGNYEIANIKYLFKNKFCSETAFLGNLTLASVFNCFPKFQFSADVKEKGRR